MCILSNNLKYTNRVAPIGVALIGVALIAATIGCVAPSPSSRCAVSSGLQVRSGHGLGPAKSAGELAFEEWVEWTDGLSEEEAIVIGLWNNPAYQELLADLQIAQADVVQAAQLRNPQVNTMFPVGPKQWELALQLPLDMLWVRPIRVSATELESHRVAERLVQDGLNVVRDVRLAYIDWQLAVQQARLMQEDVALRNEISRIAEARLAAGDLAELDVAAIRLDTQISRGNAIRATHTVELARERLRNLLGLQLTDHVLELAEPTSLPQPTDLDVDQLVSDAVSSRPDLRAVQLSINAAQQRASLARRSVWLPVLVFPDINSRGSKGFEAGPGLQFTVPLFHHNDGEVLQAQADAERLCRQFINGRDMAAMEVRQAHIQLQQAVDDLDVWHHVIPQANDAVASSRKALQENTVSLLLVLETTRQLLTSQTREREAEAQLRRAVAELERSVGHRLFDTESDDPLATETLPMPQDELGAIL